MSKIKPTGTTRRGVLRSSLTSLAATALVLVATGTGAAVLLTGCGGGSGSSTQAATTSSQNPAGTPSSQVQVDVVASQPTVNAGASLGLTATVSGCQDTGVKWAVDGVDSGNATVGTITGTGNSVTYLASSTPGTHTVSATSNADSTKSDTTTITVQAANPGAPSALHYPQSTLAATVGQAIATDTPSVTGTVTSWSVKPTLPAGIVLNSSTGAISGTPTVASASAAYTVTATNSNGSTTTSVTISAATQTGAAGFTALFQSFPSTSEFASSRTAAAMAANPWMKGARFDVAYEGLCQDTQLPLANWNGDVSSITGYSSPLSTVMIRMNANPSGSWNIQSTAAVTNMDAAVAGVVSVAKAAGTSNVLLDLENYYTNFFLNDYGQTSACNPILNSPTLTRAQMCAKMRSFGQSVGNSLWGRLPNATLYTFFGPTFVLTFTHGTGIPTTWPDANYASEPRYNMLPYFFLGLLDACPSTGHIADYIERSYYDFTGLASLQRNLTASKNWVSIFFPNESADIAKSANCWVPLPLIFVNPYFDASYGSIYPGAYYVTNVTDQQNYFTRNALYCLQQTPAGFLPGIYVENYDPWGCRGSVANMPANWETCLKNALAVYNGTTSLSSLFNVNALDTTLQNAFAHNSVWASESK